MLLTWRLLAAHRDYRFMVLAAVISLCGDWALRVGLTYYVYALTGSTVASGVMLASSLLPQLLLGSFAGVFADRWDRRRTMVVVNVASAVVLLPLLAVRSADQVWIIYLVAFAGSAVAQFFVPAEAAIVPSLVFAGHLVTANVVNSQTRDVARLVGSAVGGGLAATTGLSGLAGLDAASYLVAALLLAGIRWRPTAPDGGPGAATDTGTAAGVWSRVGGLAGEWRAGLVLASRNSTLRVLLIFAAVTSVGEGVVGALFAPFVRTTLHGSAATYGVIVAAQAAGGIVGGVVAAGTAHRFRIGPMFALAAITFGALDLLMFCYPLIWPRPGVAIAIMLVVGLPAALIVAALMSLFQAAAGDRFRGRIFGAISAVEGAGMLVGALSAGWLASRIGIVAVISFQAIAYLGSGLFVRGPLRRASAVAVGPG